MRLIIHFHATLVPTEIKFLILFSAAAHENSTQPAVGMEKRQEDYNQFFGGGSWEFCKGLETLLTSQRKQDHKQSNIDENGVDDDDGVAGVDGNGTGQMVSAKPGPLTMSLMSQSIWRYHQIDKCYHEQALPMARSIHQSAKSRGNFEPDT